MDGFWGLMTPRPRAGERLTSEVSDRMMSVRQDQRARELLRLSLELEEPERAAFLDEQCKGNATLQTV